MPTNIVIPTIGESVSSGVISSWTVPDGTYVDRDQTVLQLETDKITMDLPAPAAGVVRHRAKPGDEVAVGAIVGLIEEGAAKPATPAPTPAPAASASPAPNTAVPVPAAPAIVAPVAATVGAAAAPHGPDHHVTPLARKLADEHNVDVNRITGTGPGGRVREQDVLAAVQARGSAPQPAASANGSAKPAPAAQRRAVTVERMSQLRQRIASRLVEAQHTAAMLTTFNECDMSAVMALRKQHKEEFEKRHQIGLGFMSFFVSAVCSALERFPMVNSFIVADDQGKPAVQKHSYCDVAIAVASPKGLVVPVIRSAEGLSFSQIEGTIKDFGTRAKDGTLSLDEMTGGTFTITNGGVFGSLMSTPILNPPQSAILGMHAIKSRPIEHPAGSGQVVVRPMMYLALSYDHRIVDGAEAVQFLVHVKNCIEDPTRLLLRV